VYDDISFIDDQLTDNQLIASEGATNQLVYLLKA